MTALRLAITLKLFVLAASGVHAQERQVDLGSYIRAESDMQMK